MSDLANWRGSPRARSSRIGWSCYRPHVGPTPGGGRFLCSPRVTWIPPQIFGRFSPVRMSSFASRASSPARWFCFSRFFAEPAYPGACPAAYACREDGSALPHLRFRGSAIALSVDNPSSDQLNQHSAQRVYFNRAEGPMFPPQTTPAPPRVSGTSSLVCLYVHDSSTATADMMCGASLELRQTHWLPMAHDAWEGTSYRFRMIPGDHAGCVGPITVALNFLGTRAGLHGSRQDHDQRSCRAEA